MCRDKILSRVRDLRQKHGRDVNNVKYFISLRPFANSESRPGEALPNQSYFWKNKSNWNVCVCIKYDFALMELFYASLVFFALTVSYFPYFCIISRHHNKLVHALPWKLWKWSEILQCVLIRLTIWHTNLWFSKHMFVMQAP
jgi:hypothetical protein